MKKLFTLVLATAVVMVGSLVAPKSAEAVPAFARQVGVSCTACHFQHLPKLNAFGRSFKLGGMTQASVDLLEDDGLSIPSVMNVGMVIKYRYKKTTEVTEATIATGKERGQWNMPDEIALFVGGRMGEHWGYITEGANPDAHNKIIYSTDVGGITAGGYIYSTEGGGGAYGMEIVNNSYRMNREFENRTETMAQFALGDGIGSGVASGIGGYAANELFFAVAGLYGPGYRDVDAGFGFAKYVRVALTPSIGDGMNLIVGTQMILGEVSVGETAAGGCVDNDGAAADCVFKTTTSVYDFQLQMEDVAGMSLEVGGAMRTDAAASGLAANEFNAFNAVDADIAGSGLEDESALSVTAALGGGAFGHHGVKFAYLSLTNPDGVKDAGYTAMTFGGWLSAAQNVEFVLEYTIYSGDDDKIPHKSYMLFMLEAAL
jgi:hypothetical protein